ncbi:unnamed protein product [Closterium sp. NIES-54]
MKVDLMRRVLNRERPQKMGSSRMGHGHTSDIHDHANAALSNPILLDQHPQTPSALRTTHEAVVATGSHESAAGAGVPATQLRLDQLHLRRRRLRRLHPDCHRHRCLHLHRCHRSPHLCHHPHPHPLLRLQRRYLLPHHLLLRPCSAFPCRCGASR